MDLQNATVTDVIDAVTVYSARGRYERMNKRKYYGLSFCLDGQITYIQNGKEIVSTKECAIILPKGASYVIKGDKNGHFPLINFDCLNTLCETVTKIELTDSEQFINSYYRLRKLFCFEGNRAKIFSVFYDMLHALSSLNIPPEVETAIRFIKSNYHNPSLTNAMIANECNISEVYFRKLFVKHFGISPKQYIIDIRIQKAKQLLSEGITKISSISEEAGFSNPYHFSRLFKEHTGRTPSEYREENLTQRI